MTTKINYTVGTFPKYYNDIRTYTNEGDLVLDNAAGSGTTGVACLNTNRNFILIEKERKYCEVSQKRIRN